MIPQQDLLISPARLYKKIKEYIDNYRNNIESNDIYYYNCLLEQIKDKGFWKIYSASEHICEHEYKRGNKQGQICGAKIFISTDNKLQKYLCSRHCRDYKSNHRIYYKNHVRCKYIRKNGEQCRHRCGADTVYCYIHKDDKNNKFINDINIADKPDRDTYNKAVNKLKRKRCLYFKLKKIKKDKKQIFLTQNSYKIENEKNIKEFYKYFKNYKKHINYNSVYNLSGIR